VSNEEEGKSFLYANEWHSPYVKGIRQYTSCLILDLWWKSSDLLKEKLYFLIKRRAIENVTSFSFN
jgi:hypothetical protein